MPGIFGFTLDNSNLAMPSASVSRMLELATHQSSYVRDPIFQDENVCAGRTHTNIIQKQTQPYSVSRVHAWLHGEFHNRPELAKEQGSNAATDPQLLLELYQNEPDFRFLRKIDGIYSAVIYDAGKREVHLIIDRYGLRHLFYAFVNGSMAWGSEVKGMLGVPNFSPKIDIQAAQEFWDGGYIRDERTWFEGVALVPPASVLTWDLERRSLARCEYWSMNEIVVRDNRSESDVLEVLHVLFRDAMRRQNRDGLKTGLTLSGGMDSRLVLAAMPQNHHPLTTITFGRRASDDARIARRVARLTNSNFHFCELTEENWLPPRIAGVWWTDGMLNMNHMHVIGMLDVMSNEIDVATGGFLGDAVIGGTYLSRPPMTEIENFRQPARRFVWCGFAVIETRLPTRHPFMDNALFDFCLSIPENQRKAARLYNRFVLKYYPKFFETIPCQKAGGIPIRWMEPLPGREQWIMPARRWLASSIRRGQQLLGVDRSYEQYWRWVVKPPAREFIERLLFKGKPLYLDYLDRVKVRTSWDKHINATRGDVIPTEELGRAITIEVWLRQVFEGRRVWKDF